MDNLQGGRELDRRLAAIADPRTRRGVLGQLGLSAVSYSKEEAPVRTANMRRTIRLGAITDDSVQIVAGGQEGVGYARAVHDGSRPHAIRPRRGRILRWPRNPADRRLSGTARAGTTDFIYARSVNHPGNRANPFIVRGIARALGAGRELMGAIVKAWNEAA